MHLALRPGTDGALACGVMHVLFAEGFADRDYLARYSDAPDELERHLRARTPAWAVGDHRPAGGRDPGLRPALRRHQARLPAPGLRLHPLAQRCGRHARRLLPAGGDRRLAAPGRRRALQFRRALPLGQDDDRGPGRPRSAPSASSTSRGSARSWPASPRPWPAAAPVHALLIQNTNPMCIAPELGKVHRGFARDDLFVAVHEQFMTDTAAHGRHRPAGHHVPRARRHLPGRRPPHDPGPQADPRAVRRVPHQPLRHLRAGASAWVPSIPASP